MDKECKYISVTFKDTVVFSLSPYHCAPHIFTPTLFSAFVLEISAVPRLSNLSPRISKNRGGDKEENQDKALSQWLRIWLTWEGQK